MTLWLEVTAADALRVLEKRLSPMTRNRIISDLLREAANKDGM